MSLPVSTEISIALFRILNKLMLSFLTRMYLFTSTGRYVYDIVPNDETQLELQDRIVPFLNSSDIGRNIVWLHNNEADYTSNMVSSAAIVTGTEHHVFRWRLVTDKSVTYDDCFNRDVRCMAYEQTNKNSHIFRDLELQHSTR